MYACTSKPWSSSHARIVDVSSPPLATYHKYHAHQTTYTLNMHTMLTSVRVAAKDGS